MLGRSAKNMIRFITTICICIIVLLIGIFAGAVGAYIGTGFHTPKSGNIDFTYLHAYILAPLLSFMGALIGFSNSSEGSATAYATIGAVALSFGGNLLYHLVITFFSS